MPDHIVKSFDQELSLLSQQVTQMGKKAAHNLKLAVDAIVQQNVSQAENVISLDQEVDDMEHHIDAAAVEILALRHPVAKDLRTVVGALKIASDLERIADHATNIARRGIELKNAKLASPLSTLTRLHERVHLMLDHVLEAYEDLSHEQAAHVWHMDREVDNMYTSYLRELLTYMMEDPRHIDAATQLLFVAKNIERAGDHVTNIAEIIHYISTGTHFTPPKM